MRFRLGLTLAVLAVAPASFANGLYLKLAQGPASESGVTLTLSAVATHDFKLPQTPLFLVDDGTGMKAATGISPRPLDVPETVRVTPERSFKGSWQLDLAPGAYKVKVRYKLADRTVESNAVKVQVPGTAKAEK
ncbi:MAG TPA: hypothetical protein VFM88_12190 [Vicinamibacteria bacterium]|nr:hypothetical protein [Vicinamibacteria bacterium]